MKMKSKFLCSCPFCTNERITLYNAVNENNDQFENYDNNTKFCVLMKEYNIEVGIFLKVAWDKRKGALYN